MGMRRAVTLGFSAITACVDNQAVLRCLTGEAPKSSFKEVIEWHALAGRTRATVQTKWCPRHTGIKGNERADTLASLGLALPQTDTRVTFARVKRRARKAAADVHKQWLRQKAPSRYKTWFRTADPSDEHVDQAAKTHRESLLLPRQHLARWLMARTAHGPFRAYHERFRHQDAVLTCTCTQDRTPDHITRCPRMRAQKRLWLSKTLKSPGDWFTAMMADPGLYATIEEKGAYPRICPPHPTESAGSAQRLKARVKVYTGGSAA